jgi:transcriptional regulator GlxA family with amidase domain
MDSHDAVPTRTIGTGNDIRVREVLAFMASHLREPLTLEHLAHAVGLSPAQLSRLFRNDLGASPYAVLKHMRLERAAILLARSLLTIKAIPNPFRIAHPAKPH